MQAVRLSRLATALSFLFLLFAGERSSIAGPNYAPEINGMRERQRVYVELAGKRLVSLQKYELALDRIAWRLKPVEELFRVYSSKGDDSGQDGAQRALGALSREYAFVGSLSTELEIARKAIDQDLREAESALTEMPGGSEAFSRRKDALLGMLVGLESEALRRKRKVDESLRRWLEWRSEESARGRADQAGRALSDLEFRQAIGDLRTSFLLARNAFWMAMRQSDHGKAETLLAGHRWLRSVTPAFLIPFSTDPLRAREIGALISEIEESEASLARAFRSKKAPELRIRTMVADDIDTGWAFSGPDGEERPEIIPENEKENSCRDDRMNWGGKEFKVQSSSEYDKRVMAAEPAEPIGSIADYELKRGAFAEIDNGKPREVIPYPEARELAAPVAADWEPIFAKARETVREPERSAAPQGEAPRPENGLSRANERFGWMVDRAMSRTRRDEERAELRELRQEVDRMRRLQDYFNPRIEEEAGKGGLAERTLDERLSSLPRIIPSEPAEFAPTGSGESEAELGKIGKSIADLALGVTPGVGNAYNLGNFLSAVVTDETLLGEPALMTDKVLLGVGVVLPFVPKLGNTARAVQAVGRFVKANPGLPALKVGARMGPLIRGYQKAASSGAGHVVDRMMLENPGAVPGALQAIGKARSCAVISGSEANSSTRALMPGVEKFVDSFARDSDVIRVTFEAGSEAKAFRLSIREESQSIFGALEDPRTFADKGAYLDRMGVSPALSGESSFVHARGFKAGEEALIGKVAEVPGVASGQGVQIVSPVSSPRTWEEIGRDYR